MKLTAEQIEELRSDFAQLRSKRDLLDLLNKAKRFSIGEYYKPFEPKQLSFYYNIGVNNARYISFDLEKRDKSKRTIHAPIAGLKSIQRALNVVLQCVFNPHKAATGFVAKKSIVDNAKMHVGHRYVYNIDLQDFFFSIDQARVWKCLQLKPFHLNRENGKLELANIIASLCCTDIEVNRLSEKGEWVKVVRNVLPQGAPTSPLLSNVVCQKLDFLLNGVAKRFGLRYTRYADDITFSSFHHVYKSNSEFISEVNRIIKEQNFHIKESKRRLQERGYRQMVTGLLVNEHVNVRKRYVKQIRSWLYLWEKYGFQKTVLFFEQDFLSDANKIIRTIPPFLSVLSGKINYLGMVKGRDNSTYKSLRQKFDRLNNDKEIAIDLLLKAWDKEGMDKAMDMVYEGRGLSLYSKLDFIISLLSRPAITSVQKEKLFDLASKELKKDPTADYKIVIDELNQTTVVSKKNDTTPIARISRGFHRPRDVAEFMNLFNDPKGLKYLTHDYDETDSHFDIKQFLQNAEKIFEDRTSLGQLSIPQSLWKIVKEFAFSETPNWGINQKDGWSRPSNIQWSVKARKHLKRNPQFLKVIETFKKSIRIEAPELKSIVEEILKEKLADKYSLLKISLHDLEKADFYTNVSYFREALRFILDGCYKKCNRGDQLLINYRRDVDGDFRVRIIEICHVGSFPTRPLDEVIPEIQKGKGDFAEVLKKLRGYCNWYIDTLWDGKPIRLHLLNESEEIVTEELSAVHKINGFRHVLTYYYK